MPTSLPRTDRAAGRRRTLPVVGAAALLATALGMLRGDEHGPLAPGIEATTDAHASPPPPQAAMVADAEPARRTGNAGNDAPPPDDGSPFRGIVRRNGTPSPATAVVLVHLDDAGRAAATWRTTTNGDGRFAFASIPARGAAVIEAWSPSAGRARLTCDLAQRDVALELSTSAPLARIRGDVAQADGRPAAGAIVAFGAQVAAVDDDGRFDLAIQDLDAAADLVAWRSGSAPVSRPRFGATLVAGADVNVHLVLAMASETITGTVVDARGEPVKGCNVAVLGDDAAGRFVQRRTLRTDGDGCFAVPELAPGRYSLRANRGRDTATVAGVAAGTNDLVITLVTPTENTPR